MFKAFWSKMKEGLFSVLPVTITVLILNLTPLVKFTGKETVVFLVSALGLVVGMALFNMGTDLAMTPMGEQVGSGLLRFGKAGILLTVCFILGLLITVAEPTLSVLAAQVQELVDGTLLTVTVGIGVGLFLMLGVLRILFRVSLSTLLMFSYMLMFALASLILVRGNGFFLPLAVDSGGVTTGPITVPFIMALGIGIAATFGGKHAVENSFGLVALCAVGPILTVMLLGAFSTGTVTFSLPDYSVEAHLGKALLPTVFGVVKEVFLALGLLVALFFVIQFAFLKLPRTKVRRMMIGMGYTFFGLVIFLSSVTVGFMPIGYKMGLNLADSPSYVTALVAFFLGLVVVLAEPAVHILNRQVSEITNGSISKRSMMIALSVGVGTSLALSVIRMIFEFSILYYLIPGFLLSLGMSFFVPRMYTAIAFDSGSVASGPLTSTFILPFAIGACVAMRGEAGVLEYAFGIVAMVAMTPLISIQLLGFRSIVAKKVREEIAMKRILGADDNQIINFMREET